ncbi:hypothetical protein HPB48_017361 [Haemaphysalis longicornis]|uniref:Uncharacterized protein n=1 Tax=Haemaphysalis longicornis TaxID=44386 RepID=A0A9J6GCC9_HAELO|nr:hypothetical protein HPB48_017361 [Haemaphysalis longicornis]
MEQQTKKRKCYLYESSEFRVPSSTRWHRREERHQSEAETSGTSDSSATPGTSSIAADAPSCATSSEEDVNMEENFFDCSEGIEGSEENSAPVPPEDTHETLKAALDEYGDETLSGSTTTKAAAIVMILAFVVAHGLPWDTVDGLLRLINALFGFRRNVLPRSKYLLRKMWSSQIDRYVKHTTIATLWQLRSGVRTW